MADATAVFSLRDEQDQELRAALQEIYSALQEKGYNPVNQIVGYLLSEDPTYITTYKNARNLIRKIDRDDLLQSMVRSYVGQAYPPDSAAAFKAAALFLCPLFQKSRPGRGGFCCFAQ